MTNAVSIAQSGSNNSTMRNRVINGDMRVAQRGTGLFTVDNGNWYYPVDRFSAYQSVASSKFTVQQNAGSVTPPPGFNYYLGATVTSAYSPTGGDWFPIRHTIEGYNWADLAFGTANAKTFTASFWVRSSLTGTMGGAFYNNDGSRSYPFTYTISAANTWEFKTITVAGDTSGTWNSTNNGGITIQWSMGGGSTLVGTAGAWASGFYVAGTGATNIVATNGATLYIAGVQMEVGSQATPFEYRQFGTEVTLCQRYFYKHASGGGGSNDNIIGSMWYYTSAFALTYIKFPTTMRTNPTAMQTSGTDFYGVYRNGTGDFFNSLTLNTSSATGVELYNDGQMSGTAGQVGGLVGNSASMFLGFNAEL